MKAKTTKATNPYKTGDIVTTTWGYSMIIVDFYEVTRVTPSKVELRQLKQRPVMTGYLSGHTIPIPGEYEDYGNGPYAVREGQLFKVRPDGLVVIPSYPGAGDHNFAHKWDGEPEMFDHCD